MVEYLLQRPELLAILDAIQVEDVVGIEHSSLFPPDTQQRRTVITQGVVQLQQQHLLIMGVNETPILDRNLFATVSAVALPDIAVIVVRNVSSVGPQLFLEYVSGRLVVEQTFPREELHRLVLLGNVTSLMERMAEILPLPAGSSDQNALQPQASPGSFTVSQDIFFTVEQLIEGGQSDEAYALLASETSETSTVDRFFSAFDHPVLRGNVAMLRCRAGEIIDARNAAFVSDAHRAWMVAQRSPGEPVLTISPATADQAQQGLWQWYHELAAVG